MKAKKKTATKQEITQGRRTSIASTLRGNAAKQQQRQLDNHTKNEQGFRTPWVDSSFFFQLWRRFCFSISQSAVIGARHSLLKCPQKKLEMPQH